MWQPTHVKVAVNQATNLLIKGKHGTNDAFVVIGIGKEKYHTSIKQKSSKSVEWKEECELEIPSQGNKAFIQLTVYHHNSLGIDEFLGQVALPLLEFDVYEKPKYRFYKLKGKADKDKKKGEKERGELEVLVNFHVKSGSLLEANKKEKTKSSTSLRNLGGSLMSFGGGKDNKHGIKDFARSVSSKMDKIAKRKKSKGKSEKISAELMKSSQYYGDADPGVISDEDDDFRFDDEIKVFTRSSSPHSTISRGSSFVHEIGFDDDGASHTSHESSQVLGTSLLSYDTPNILGEAGGNRNVVKSGTSAEVEVSGATSGRLDTTVIPDIISEHFEPQEDANALSKPDSPLVSPHVRSSQDKLDNTYTDYERNSNKNENISQNKNGNKYKRKVAKMKRKVVEGSHNTSPKHNTTVFIEDNGKNSSTLESKVKHKGSLDKSPITISTVFVESNIVSGNSNEEFSDNNKKPKSTTANRDQTIDQKHGSKIINDAAKHEDINELNVTNISEDYLIHHSAKHEDNNELNVTNISDDYLIHDSAKREDINELNVTNISEDYHDYLLHDTAKHDDINELNITKMSDDYRDSKASTMDANVNISTTYISSDGLHQCEDTITIDKADGESLVRRNFLNEENPVAKESGTKPLGVNLLTGSHDDVSSADSKLNLNLSRTNSNQDISIEDFRQPKVKALTLNGKITAEDVENFEGRKKRKAISNFKNKIFHKGSGKLAEEDGRCVEGGNDRVPAPPTGTSRLPQEIHDRFAGKSREELLEMIMGLQGVVDKQVKRTSDLEHYLDHLLLRVMEASPQILQSEGPTKKIKTFNQY